MGAQDEKPVVLNYHSHEPSKPFRKVFSPGYVLGCACLILAAVLAVVSLRKYGKADLQNGTLERMLRDDAVRYALVSVGLNILGIGALARCRGTRVSGWKPIVGGLAMFYSGVGLIYVNSVRGAFAHLEAFVYLFAVVLSVAGGAVLLSGLVAPLASEDG